MPVGGERVAAWVSNSPEGRSQVRPWTLVWRSRELIGYLALRDVKLRYRQAVLGVAWVILQPVASVALFTLVFDRLAGISSQSVPYPLFALVGMVAWTYFSSAVISASQVLVTNASLVTKVRFTRIAAPAAALLPPLVDLGVSLVLVAALLLYYGQSLGIEALALPVWLVLLTLTAFGVGLWASALNVRYRDVQYAITPVLQLWLFASPVAYPSALLDGWAGLFYSLNPVVGVIELGRWTLLGTPWPGLHLAVSLTTSAAVLLSGVVYFQRSQRTFADVI